MKLMIHLKFVGFHCYQHMNAIWHLLIDSGPKTALVHVSGLISNVFAWYSPQRQERRQMVSTFDQNWGTDTSGVISPRHLALEGENALFSNYYRGSKPKDFNNLLGQIDLDFERFIFVDYGSGKGLILMLASEYPFKKIIGVELSPKLDAIARANLGKYTSPTQKCRNIELLCQDATRYELPPEPAILFLFEPFTELRLFSALLANIERSLAQHPRDVFILYIGSKFKRLLDESSPFALRHASQRSFIFQNRTLPS